MRNRKYDAFVQYLDTRTTAVQESINRLIADNRRDESDFEKIKANIYQMVKTIFQASQKTSNEESEQVSFFDSRLTMIENTWKASLEKAEEHRDERKILQEQIKLEAMKEIRATFIKIWEVGI